MSDRLLNAEMLDSYRELSTPEDPHFFRVFLEKFLEGVPGYVAEIEQAIRGADPAGLARAAHALKSTCLNVGAEAIVVRSAKLEAMGKSGSTGDAAPIAAEISSLCRSLDGEIRALPEFR